MKQKICCIRSICLFGCGVLLATTSTAFADWTSFRNGGTSTVTAPVRESWQPNEGIAWQRELKGYGQSAPVVWQNHVYVCSVVGPQKEEAVVTCYDRDSGDVLWSASQPTSQQAPSNYMNSRAAPTPVVDAAGVYAFFESGDLLAIDHAGTSRWNVSFVKQFGPLDSNHGLGSSPIQTDTAVILNVEHRGPSYLVAIDKTNGEVRWKVDRPSGSSWSSPVIRETTDGAEVILSSQGTVAGYSAGDGRKNWEIDGLTGNTVPSPCYQDGHLLIGARLPEFGSARAATESNLCLAFDESTGVAPTVKWKSTKAVCDYASPIIAGDFVYILTKVGILHCLDRETGKTHYRERVGTECWATPLVSADRLFLFARNGETKVIGIGPEFQLLYTSQLWPLDNPPQPETYQEASRGGHGHGESAGGRPGSANARGESEKEQATPAPGGRFARMLLANDANQNGQLEADEVPEQLREMLKAGDTNQDEILDQDEIVKMAEEFQKRRASSRDSSRDPIVYGVAASDGKLFIRTGTRLYCIGGNE